MPIPQERRRSYLARQVGTLALSQVRVDNPMAAVRAATWHNTCLRVGIYLPLFIVHDLGLLFSAPRGAGGWSIGPHPNVRGRELAPAQVRHVNAGYRELLERVAQSEVIEKAATWRLRDDMVAMLIARVLGDTYHAWSYRAKGSGSEELPVDPQLYTGADVLAHFSDFDPDPLWSFLDHLRRQTWHVYTCVEQIDLDTLRLVGLFREGAGASDPLSGAVDLADLFQALGSPEANDVVNFSLELLPSVLETKRASGVQTFAVDGYASIERRGNLDSLVLTEFAWDDELFARKIVDDELYYYGHEKQREEERRLQYLLIDSSASMRGARQVFARGLALTLAKKLVLEGDEIWMRFFDSRLYDVVKMSRTGSINVPYLLCFRSERGRNYGKVFRQLVLELMRIKREAPRRVVLYIITHGQCHIPVELVQQLKGLAYLYGIIILPSSEVTLEYLPLFDRYQIVGADVLRTREARKDRALHIVKESVPHADAARSRGPDGP